MITSKELERELAQCIGTEHYYKLRIPKITYTDGVKVFAEKAEAMWLVVDIGLYLFKPKLNRDPFLSITLKVKDNKGELVFDDGNDNVLYTKTYGYTDCPEGEWKFFYCDGVLMVPSEY